MLKPLMITLLLVAALTVIPGLGSTPTLACGDVDPVDLIPGSEACEGVVLDGDVQSAYTLAELTAVINGEAFLYTGYGWVASAFQNYTVDTGAPVAATLSLFNQGTAANAEALYNDPQSGSGDAIGDWGGSGAARLRAGFGVTTLQFWEECLFVKIVVLSESPEATHAARCLADALVILIQGQTPMDVETWSAIKALYK
jgi:hypothetical protein